MPRWKKRNKRRSRSCVRKVSEQIRYVRRREGEGRGGGGPFLFSFPPEGGRKTGVRNRKQKGPEGGKEEEFPECLMRKGREGERRWHKYAS